MKHKIEHYTTSDVIGCLDYDDNNELVISVEMKDDVVEVNVRELLEKLVGSTVQIKSVFEG